jgi:hypothetical protein
MRLARILVAIAIGVPLVVSMPGRAVACSCAIRDAKHVIADADAIVAGHVVAQVEADPMHTMSSVAVDGVYKGRIGPSITLRAGIGSGGGSDCAVLYPVGSKVDPLVLFQRQDGTYTTDACAMPVVGRLSKLLGMAHPPSADGPSAVPLPTPVQAPPPAAAPPSGAKGVSWPAVLGGAVIGVGLIAWAIRRTAREHVAAGPTAADAEVRGEGDAPPPVEPSG